MNAITLSESEKKKKHPVETETVLQRLKDFLGLRTNVELSDILDIKPNTLSTWKKRNTLDYKRVLTVCHTYKLDINRLFFNNNTPRPPRTDGERRGFLVVPREEYYPYVANFRDSSYINALPKFDFPFISGNKVRAFQIVGSGMSPRLKDGDYVVGEYVEDTDTIADHHIYVLVSNVKGIFINRVKQDPESPGSLLLINEKEQVAAPRVRMSTDEILEMWKVNSVFSLDLIGERSKSKVL